uniref:hypothetical protein n=1 Tax=Sphingomonas sp. S-NIH.Pt15_0812 TaxID=1920129 RepID=UPI0026A16198
MNNGAQRRDCGQSRRMTGDDQRLGGVTGVEQLVEYAALELRMKVRLGLLDA